MKLPHRADLPFSLRRLDRQAVDVVRTLQEHGFESYLVGGCVRDALLGHEPKDYDIATAARPGQVRRLFRRSRIIGRRFRIVHVYAGRDVFEIATFRREPPKNGRSADEPITDDNSFGNAKEDALRRDFTVNGLFLDPRKQEIVDYVGGLADLERRTMISIGDPDLRFREDPVRILRLIKFMRRLGLASGKAEIAAAREHAGMLAESADPRLVEELFRLMQTGDMAGCLIDLRALGVLPLLAPDIAEWLERAPDNLDRLLSMFEALDRWVCDGGEPGYGFRLACLYGPMVEDEIDPDQRTVPVREVSQVPVFLLGRLQQRARLPRAAISRATQILLAQEQMDPEREMLRGKKRRRRKGAQERLLAADCFPDALEFLRCRLEAAERDPAPYDEWHELGLSFPGP
jgi:poly(A) polymerase